MIDIIIFIIKVVIQLFLYIFIIKILCAIFATKEARIIVFLIVLSIVGVIGVIRFVKMAQDEEEKKRQSQIVTAYNEGFSSGYNEGYKIEEKDGEYLFILQNQKENYEKKTSEQQKIFNAKIKERKAFYASSLSAQKAEGEKKVSDAQQRGLEDGKKFELQETEDTLKRQSKKQAEDGKWNEQIFKVK